MTVSAGGTGAITLGSAVSGYQAFAAGDDGKTFPYAIQDGTAWETGRGTYTHSGTSFARTSRTASSTGSALTVTTSAFLFVDMISTNGQNMDAAQQSVAPGGRLTLTSGTPVTTGDVTGATTVYYTPYVGNTISLWDGNWWQAIIFAEVSLALGTLTNNQCYDVFGFYNAGALNTEMLAWTNNTTRATTVTLQDGRYCKNGDKTRLYLGSFLTTSTTTTESSSTKRLLYNQYNQVPLALTVLDTTVHSYNGGARPWNNSSANAVQWLCGQTLSSLPLLCYSQTNDTNSSSSGFIVGSGLDSTTVMDNNYVYFFSSVGGTNLVFSSSSVNHYKNLAIGSHFSTALEQSVSAAWTANFVCLSSTYMG